MSIFDERHQHDHLMGVHLLSENLSGAVRDATTAATAAQTAAGHAANTTLSGEMGALATDQLKTANNFRVGAIGLSVIAAITAALLTLLAPTTEPTGLASHVVITAGIAGLAGYAGVQSSKHRRLGDWCKVLSVQLQTFNAYLEPIADDAVKDDIRRQFAVRAFSPVADPSGTDDGGVTIAQQLMAAVPFSMKEKG